MDRATFFNPATEPYEKWKAFASVFPSLMGNPARDWMRMTLADLGVSGALNSENAGTVWNRLAERLAAEDARPVNVFKNSQVAMIGTTDNPFDSLSGIVRAEEVFGKGTWRPTWRPDAFMQLTPSPISPRSWLDCVEALERIADRALKGNFAAFQDALAERHDFFARHGCRAGDYGFAVPAGHSVPRERAGAVFDRACRAGAIEPGEALDFQAFLFRFSMGLDFDKGWLSQVHFGPARNLRRVAQQHGGLDSGCDTLNGFPGVVAAMHDLLNHFDSAGTKQHRILLYASSRGDWEKIAGLSRIFPCVYSGTAWWYFDSVSGMLEFFETIPDIGAGFLKMGPFVTDTRNIYSLKPRTEMYRRCLSTALGRLVEFRGERIEEAVALARHLCVDHPRGMLGIF
jgi:glucuronate isomerase